MFSDTGSAPSSKEEQDREKRRVEERDARHKREDQEREEKAAARAAKAAARATETVERAAAKQSQPVSTDDSNPCVRCKSNHDPEKTNLCDRTIEGKTCDAAYHFKCLETDEREDRPDGRVRLGLLGFWSCVACFF